MHRFDKVFFAVAMVTASVLVAEECHDYKLAFIPKAKGEITIDGKLDEAAWNRAQPITDYEPGGWSRNMTAWMPPTETRLLWDEKYLYISVKCHEDTDENMARFCLQAADPSDDVFQRDLVEFHVNGPNPGELPKYQVALCPSKVKSIIHYYDNGWGQESDNDFARVADFEKASYIDKEGKYWVIEAKIAHESLGTTAKVGFRLGFNIGRLRFNKQFVDSRTKEPCSVNYVLCYAWGCRNQHSTKNSRGIFVDDLPADTVSGLRLSYPDLDQRTVYVQSSDKYVVVENGLVSEQPYLEKARSLIEKGLKELDDFASITNGIPEPAPGFFKKCFANPLKVREELLKRKAETDQLEVCDFTLINAIEAQGQKWKDMMDSAYWTMIRDLMIAEGKVRFPVKLSFDPAAPTWQQQFDRVTPSPFTRVNEAPVWAKPLAKGKKKVFIGVSFGDAYAAWEIMHRLDIDADVVQLEDFIHTKQLIDLNKEWWFKKGEKAAMIANLFAKNDYDAYIFLGTNIGVFPGHLQCVLVERMLKGAKVMQYNEGHRWLAIDEKNQVDRSLLAGFPKITRLKRKARTEFETETVDCVLPPFYRRSVGNGEFLFWLPGAGEGYREHTKFTPGWSFMPEALFNDEYVYAACTRMIAEACGALGPARLDSAVAQDAAPGESVVVTVSVREPADNAMLELKLRNAKGTVIAEKTVPLGIAGHHDYSFPGLETGRYFVDATAKIDGKVCDFVSGSFRVAPVKGIACGCTPDCRQFKAPAVFGAVIPRREPFRVTDPIEVSAVVSNAYAGLTVDGELVDPNGRVIEKGSFAVDVTNGIVKVDFPAKRLVENCHIVSLKLMTPDGKLLAETSKAIYRKIGLRDDLTVMTSGFFQGGINGLKRQAMLDYYGFNACQDGSPARLMFGGDAAIRNRVHGSGSEDGASLSSPYFHDVRYKAFNDTARKISKYNGVLISCGDDSRAPGEIAQTSPDWVVPFFKILAEQLEKRMATEKKAPWEMSRTWLQEHGIPDKTAGAPNSLAGKYRSLATLPLILGMKLYPVDVVNFRNAFKQAYRDKTAIEMFNRQNGVNITSWDDVDEKLIASIKPTASSEFVHFQFWLRDVKYKGDIAALNTSWHTEYKDFFDIRQEDFGELIKAEKFGGEIDRREYIRHLAVIEFATMRKAVDAVDRDISLFMGCSHYGNSMVESMAILGSTCPYWGRYKETEWLRSQKKTGTLFGQTLGTYGSPRETKESREYDVWQLMSAGCNLTWFWDTFLGFQGMLGVEPGLAGYTCDAIRELKRGPAKLLLGAKRENLGIRILLSVRSGSLEGLRSNGRTPHQARVVAVQALEKAGFTWDTIISEQVEKGIGKDVKVLILPSSLMLSQKEADAIRAWVKNGGVLLADSAPGICAYNGDMLEKPMLGDVPMDILDFQSSDTAKIRELVAKAGIQPIAYFREGDRDLDGAEIVKFTRGNAEFVLLRKKPTGADKFPMSAELVFPTKAYTWEQRTGKYLGLIDRVEVKMDGFFTELYTRLPYEVESVAVIAPDSVARGETLVIDAEVKRSQTAQTEKLAAHVFRIDLVPPGGYTPERKAPIPYHVIEATNGKTRVEIAIAWNEPFDDYTLEVTDISTGIKTSKTIAVK